MTAHSTELLGNVLGAVGTTMLVLAFVLNATGKVRVSFLYTYLNLFGAGLAGVASALINFVPFLVLESVWFVAAAAKLVSLHRGSNLEPLPARNSTEA